MSSKDRILIVDESEPVRSALVGLLRKGAASVEAVADGFEALDNLTALAPHLVLLDLQMSAAVSAVAVAIRGDELLAKIREHDPEIAVVVMTAPAGVADAITAMRSGARDYLIKPINPAQLAMVVARELEHRRLRAEAGQLRARLSERYRFENMIGSSAPMQAVFKAVSQAATARTCVTLRGEAGTGKELIAAAIHEKGPRAKDPFVVLRCASLAEPLLESELFGHERGSFPGAIARRDGCLFQANGGTLFLDEIGALTPALQGRLLRLLREHQFERMGGGETVNVDVRVIAASQRDPNAMTGAAKLQEGLLHELGAITIEVPALRERPSDVPLLALHFLNRHAVESQKAIGGFTEEALERLCAYPWPGNVRQLEDAIERAVAACRGPKITPAELPPDLPAARAASAIQIPGSTLDSIERYAITRTLDATDGSTSRAAEILGISVRKVQYKLQQYDDSAPPVRTVPATNLKRN